MARNRPTGQYPPDWPAVATAVKDEAGWRCVRCGRPHEPAAGYCLTVHHLNGRKDDCAWHNLAALCQRCHLSVQARVDMDRPWVMTEHTPWFRPYVAGHYARKYLGQTLSREDVMTRLDELLGLERRAVMGDTTDAAE